MCSVFQFSDDNEVLKNLLKERNPLDSILFVFEGFHRYKIPVSSLGISRVGELFYPSGRGFQLARADWQFYLYPNCSCFSGSIDMLCGEVIRKTGSRMNTKTAHVFVHRSRRQLKILYQHQGEYRVEQRRLTEGLYELNTEELSAHFTPLSLFRLNAILTVRKKKNNRKIID